MVDDAAAHQPRRFLSAAAGLALVAAAVGTATWGVSYDDAYITYRYADHLARGDGLVFNPGEVVLGTTAPGFAALLGAATWLARSVGLDALDPVAWGTLSGLFGLWLAGVSALWMLAREGVDSTDLGWAAVWGMGLLVLRWNVELLGAETLPIVGLVTLSAVLLFVADRPVLAGLATAGAIALRFDAGLAAVALALVAWARDGFAPRRLPWAYVVGTLPAALVIGAVTWFFGSPIPQTMAGKRGEFAARDLASYTGAQWYWLSRDFGRTGATLLLLTAAMGLGLLVTRAWARRADASPWWLWPTGAMALWLALHEGFYRLARVPFAPWYHVATVASLWALACVALHAMVHRRVGWRRQGRVGAEASVLALVVTGLILQPSIGFLATTRSTPPDPRIDLYSEVGTWLDDHTEPGAVAMVEIGAAGYHAPRHPVFDLVGLVSPRALDLGDTPLHELEDPQLRYVVDVPLFHSRFPALAHLDPRHWRELATFEDPASGRGRVVLWQRRVVRQDVAEATDTANITATELSLQ